MIPKETQLPLLAINFKLIESNYRIRYNFKSFVKDIWLKIFCNTVNYGCSLFKFAVIFVRFKGIWTCLKSHLALFKGSICDTD